MEIKNKLLKYMKADSNILLPMIIMATMMMKATVIKVLSNDYRIFGSVPKNHPTFSISFQTSLPIFVCSTESFWSRNADVRGMGINYLSSPHLQFYQSTNTRYQCASLVLFFWVFYNNTQVA